MYWLEKRRNFKLLKIVFKMRFKLYECSTKWLNEIEFYETSRNGIFCRMPLHQTICNRVLLYMPHNCITIYPNISDVILFYKSFVNQINLFL